MATRGPNDDGSIADLPWASVFDPASNIRALSVIQARGFRAASEVVDRLVKLAEPGPAVDDGEHRAASSPDGGPDVDRVLSTWQTLIGQLTASIRDQPARQAGAAQSGSAEFDLVNSSAGGQVHLAAVSPGVATTEVWLHNGGPVDLGRIQLRCSDLLAHDGGVVSSAVVRFEPETVPLVARSSRGVIMTVQLTDDVRPGCYRGTLLAEGHADVWLPVALAVAAPAS